MKEKKSREEQRVNVLSMLREMRKDYLNGNAMAITKYARVHHTTRFYADDLRKIITDHEPTMDDVRYLYSCWVKRTKVYRNETQTAEVDQEPASNHVIDFRVPDMGMFKWMLLANILLLAIILIMEIIRSI